MDRENRPLDLDFTISAEDNGQPSFKSDKIPIKVILIDINDHPPRFNNAGKTQQSLGIKESVPVGTEIMRIDIIDQDLGKNKEVRLSITDDQTASFKAIPSRDHSQAIITTLKPLDFETKPEHEFLLTAYSKGKKIQKSQLPSS